MGDFWSTLWDWGSEAPANAIGQNVDGSYITNGTGGGLVNSLLGASTNTAKDSMSNLWGPLITAGGGLASTYFAADQNRQNNDIAIEQANAQRAWAEAQQEKQVKAQAEAARLQAEAAQKIAKMNNMASLYQSWGAMNQRAGEAIGQSAVDTGKMASGAIMARAANLR